MGDIIHNNRGGNAFDYAYAASHSSYDSHTAIVITEGADSNGRYVETVGGNESDSVRRKRVQLNARGFVMQRTDSPYICVVQTLK